MSGSNYHRGTATAVASLERRISMQSSRAYPRTAVALHWFIALLITCGFTLGATMTDLHMSPKKLRLYSYHKWIGITVLGLVLIRLLWRLAPRPPPDKPMLRRARNAAPATNLLVC